MNLYGVFALGVNMKYGIFLLLSAVKRSIPVKRVKRGFTVPIRPIERYW